MTQCPPLARRCRVSARTSGCQAATRCAWGIAAVGSGACGARRPLQRALRPSGVAKRAPLQAGWHVLRGDFDCIPQVSPRCQVCWCLWPHSFGSQCIAGGSWHTTEGSVAANGGRMRATGNHIVSVSPSCWVNFVLHRMHVLFARPLGRRCGPRHLVWPRVLWNAGLAVHTWMRLGGALREMLCRMRRCMSRPPAVVVGRLSSCSHRASCCLRCGMPCHCR